MTRLFCLFAVGLLLLPGCGKEKANSQSDAVESSSGDGVASSTEDADSVSVAEDETTGPQSVALFDGSSFTGWDGDLEIFRIEDEAIVGGTLNQKIANNEFLTTTREYADFELRLKFMLKGDNTNAGVQIRSRRIDDPPHEMIGYQADLGQSYWGCLYDESRRRKVLTGPDKEELDKVLKREDWNDYRIRCEGKRIQLWINGLQTVDYTEEDDTIEQTGLIGLQIHSGPPGEAWYKDIEIEELGL
jgi:hypothetical protein